MELMPKQKDLLTVLQHFNLDSNLIVLVMSACQDDDSIVEMINFLIDKYDEKKSVTEQEILQKIVDMN